MGLAEWVVVISIILQFVAAGFAVRMIGVTGRRMAWLLVAAAVILMGIRRSMSLIASVGTVAAQPLDLGAESVALTISALMAVGMFLLKPLFEDAVATRRRADHLQTYMGALAALLPEGVVQFRLRPSEDGSTADLQLLEVNPAFESLSGFTFAGSPAPTLDEALPLAPGDRAVLVSALLGMVEGKRPPQAEMTLPSLDRWFACSFYLIEEDAFIAIVRDRTKEQVRSGSIAPLIAGSTSEFEQANSGILQPSEGAVRV